VTVIEDKEFYANQIAASFKRRLLELTFLSSKHEEYAFHDTIELDGKKHKLVVEFRSSLVVYD